MPSSALELLAVHFLPQLLINIADNCFESNNLMLVLYLLSLLASDWQTSLQFQSTPEFLPDHSTTDHKYYACTAVML